MYSYCISKEDYYSVLLDLLISFLCTLHSK